MLQRASKHDLLLARLSCVGVRAGAVHGVGGGGGASVWVHGLWGVGGKGAGGCCSPKSLVMGGEWSWAVVTSHMCGHKYSSICPTQLRTFIKLFVSICVSCSCNCFRI